MAKTKKANPLAGSRNLELALAMRGKGGNLTHDPRPRRQRTRSAQRRNAIRDHS
jgi:hypothetical protein